MVSRLYLVEVDPAAFSDNLKQHSVDASETLITETFIPQNDGEELVQLQAHSQFTKGEIPEQKWYKTVFHVTSNGWKLELLKEIEEITSEVYYELLLSTPNETVEQKVRTEFTLEGRDYILDVNGARNYAVVRVDGASEDASPESLFRSLTAVTVVGELFMSLEETFCRLYLKRAQSLKESRVF